jgi:hypothetical protein
VNHVRQIMIEELQLGGVRANPGGKLSFDRENSGWSRFCRLSAKFNMFPGPLYHPIPGDYLRPAVRANVVLISGPGQANPHTIGA